MSNSSHACPDLEVVESDPPARSGRVDLSAAAEDRRLAAADRRRANDYLESVYRDRLTGALSRQPGQDQLIAEIGRAQRTTSALCVVFADIDGLKSINDGYGHRRGDEVLAATGRALRASFRVYDLVVRWGGDEFVCALPGATENVASVGLHRAAAILDAQLPGSTFSFGLASLQGDDDQDRVVARADGDLYRRRSAATGVIKGPQLRTTHPRASASEGCVECAACGSWIPLTDFHQVNDQERRQLAECRVCRRQSVIGLVPLASDQHEKR